jgi:NOL1/NOP2/fmu family ribosome biogenesis protein
MKILTAAQKKKIVKQLQEQYGISEIPHLFLKFGKEKIRIYSGNFSREELIELQKNLRLENMGLYLATQHQEQFRLSLDALQVFKEQITKNILELNDKQTEQWFKGQDLDIQTDNNFKVLKHNQDFIGCGKSTGERITNCMPKERRIKHN